MYDNKQSIGKWKRALIAAALAACMVVALPGWSVGSAKADDVSGSNPTTSVSSKTLDTAKWNNCTLTVKRAGEAENLQGSLVVDLYKVATATQVSGYDAYELTLDDGYNSDTALAGALEAAMNQENASAGVNKQYRDLAQSVAKAVLGVNEGKVTGTKDSVVAKRFATITLKDGKQQEKFTQALPAGMYLVIAHGESMEDPKEYTAFLGNTAGTAEDASGFNAAVGQEIVTWASSNGITYTYLPELISLPMRTANGTAGVGSFNTASRDDWYYSVTVELKSEQDVDKVPLVINKSWGNSQNLDKDLTGSTSATFRVVAMLNGVEVYRNVVTISSEQTKQDDEILVPIGATVTVTELNAGGNYDATGSVPAPAVITVQPLTTDETGATVNPNMVSFTNNYNGNNINGGVLTNRFRYDAEKGWTWIDPNVTTNTQPDETTETTTPAE